MPLSTHSEIQRDETSYVTALHKAIFTNVPTVFGPHAISNLFLAVDIFPASLSIARSYAINCIGLSSSSPVPPFFTRDLRRCAYYVGIHVESYYRQWLDKAQKLKWTETCFSSCYVSCNLFQSRSTEKKFRPASAFTPFCVEVQMFHHH